MYDLIIIGSGPAGITAGIYAARKKLKILMITRDFLGQVGWAFTIENYPGFEKIRGQELAQRFEKQVKRFDNIEVKQGQDATRILKKEDGVFNVKTSDDKDYSTRAVIVATGRDPRPLEVPGEKEFLGKGVGYCVTCDGPIFQDKTVAVIGGGNSGFDASLELAKYCSKIYILEFGDKPLADESTQEKAGKNQKIHIILNAETKKIKGDKFVNSLIYKNRKTNEQKELKVEGIFIQIGYVPATGFVKDLVEFNKKDEIKIDPITCATKTPGLFAAGDVTSMPVKQVITSAAEGAKAALSAYQYLQK